MARARKPKAYGPVVSGPKKKTAKRKRKPARRRTLPEAAREYTFKKGNVANPRGRPKGRVSLFRAMQQQLQESASLVEPIAERAREIGLDPNRSSIGAVLTLSSLCDCCEDPAANASMIREVLDRVDGKVASVVANIDAGSLADLSDADLQKIIDLGATEE